MASFAGDNSQRCNTANLFKKIRKKIEESFDCIVQKANERRTALLSQLTELERNDPEEMKYSKQEMEQLLVTMSCDEAKKSLQKSIDELTKKISDCEIKCSEISFVCETNELEWRISQLGVLSTSKVNTVRRYKLINKPMLSFGTRGTGTKQFSGPRGVLVDEDNNRVMICDYNRIQIWSMSGEYLTEFGAGILKWPREVAHHDTSIFVTDFESHLVSKWCYNCLHFIAKSKTTQGTNPGQLLDPTGIDIDSGEVFVLECSNNRISVFDLDLRFKRVMADRVINMAYCLRIRSDIIYVVERSGVIKLLSKSDQLIRIIDRSDLFSGMVFHFNFDSTLNFLITDRTNNSLSMLSPEGELMHTIRFGTWGVKDPFGIDVTRDGNIVVSFQGGSFPVIVC